MTLSDVNCAKWRKCRLLDLNGANGARPVEVSRDPAGFLSSPEKLARPENSVHAPPVLVENDSDSKRPIPNRLQFDSVSCSRELILINLVLMVKST